MLTSLTLSFHGLDGTLISMLPAFAWALYVDRGAPFPVGVSFFGLTAGLERLGGSRVMVCMYLIPVAGVGLSAAFCGDPLTAARVLGGLIVLLGVF